MHGDYLVSILCVFCSLLRPELLVQSGKGFGTIRDAAVQKDLGTC